MRKLLILLLLAVFQLPALSTTSIQQQNKQNYSCPDHVPGQIIVQMKQQTISPQPSLRSKRLSISRSIGFQATSNNVRSYITAKYKNIHINKANKIYDNQTHLNKALLRKARFNTKLQTTSSSLNNNMMDRTFVIKVQDNDCQSYMSIIKQLNEDPGIEYAEPDQLMEMYNIDDVFFNSNSEHWDYDYPEMWGLHQIKAESAWSQTKGANVHIAVIDSGVEYNHPDLWDNIWVDPLLVDDANQDGLVSLDDLDTDGNKFIDESELNGLGNVIGYDAADGNNDPQDGQGHGTHVAGTAAAGINNLGIVGVAPEAKIIPIKIQEDSMATTGFLSVSAAVAGLMYLEELAETRGMKIVTNNSWGFAGENRTLEQAFDSSSNAGIIHVVAAGNSNTNTRIFTPANYSNTIAVASSTLDDRKSSFSNFDLMIDISAPGGGDAEDGRNRNILSTTRLDMTIPSRNNSIILNDTNLTGEFQYLAIAGTSMASPHIAGAAALLVSQSPELSFEEIRSLLKNTGDIIDSEQYVSTRVNLENAIANINNPPPTVFIRDRYITIGGDFPIQGTVSSNELDRYEVYYAVGDYTLASELDWQFFSSNNQVTSNSTLTVFDTNLVPEGPASIRIDAYDISGRKVQEYSSYTVDNLELISPQIDNVGSNELSGFRFRRLSRNSLRKATISAGSIPVTVNILADLNSRDASYDVEVFDFDGNNISNEELITLSQDTTNLESFDIAQIDSSKLPAPGEYTVRVTLRIGDVYTHESGQFIYEPRLHPGWPKEIADRSDDISRLEGHFLYDDIDFDGKDDILLGHGFTTILNAENILEGWDSIEGFETSTAPVLADLDGDSVKEVVVNFLTEISIDFLGQTRIIKERNGIKVFNNKAEPMPELELILDRGVAEIRSVDINNDNNDELVLIFPNRQMKILDLNDQGTFTVTDVSIPSGLISRNSSREFVIGDFDNDNNKEIAYFTGTSAGTAQGVIVNFEGEIEAQWLIDNEDHSTAHDTVAADLDNDGDLELINFYLGGRDGNNDSSELDNQSINITAYHHDGSLVDGWPRTFESSDYYSLERFRPGLSYWLSNNNLVVGDLENDGHPEIFVSAMTTAGVTRSEQVKVLFGLRGNGEDIEGFPFTRTKTLQDLLLRPRSVVAIVPDAVLIADIDTDTDNELIMISESNSDRSTIEAFNKDLSPVNGFPLYSTDGLYRINYEFEDGAIQVYPMIGDFDGDDKFEISFLNEVNELNLYDLDTPVSTIEWGMYRGNAKKSGVYSSRKPSERRIADLFPRLTVDKHTANPGDVITLEVQGRSKAEISNSPAYSVIGEITVPETLEYLDEDGDECSLNGNKVVCNYHTIQPGRMKAKQLKFRLPEVDTLTSYQFTDVSLISTSSTLRTIDPNRDQVNTIRIVSQPEAPEQSIDKIADLFARLRTRTPIVSAGNDIIVELQARSRRGVSTHPAYQVTSELAIPNGLEYINDNTYCNEVEAKVICDFFTIHPAKMKRAFLRFRAPSDSSPRNYVFRAATVESQATNQSQATVDPKEDSSNAIRIRVE